MSVKVMGWMWDLALPHQELIVLLAMADHADHTGGNIHPSLGLIAWKCNYSLRQVRRIVGDLKQRGILHATPQGQGKASVYRILPQNAPKKPPYSTRNNGDLGHGDLGHGDLSDEEEEIRPTISHQTLGHGDLGHGDLGHGDLGHLRHRPRTSRTSPPSSSSPRPPSSSSSPPKPSLTVKPLGKSAKKSAYLPGFLRFWAEYPRKKGKDAAWRSWQRQGLEVLATEIDASVIEHQAKDDDWQRGFIPHPATFLNSGGWKDELDGTPQPVSQNGHRSPRGHAGHDIGHYPAGDYCKTCKESLP